jgi:superfamily II DNA helicase RecQ
MSKWPYAELNLLQFRYFISIKLTIQLCSELHQLEGAFTTVFTSPEAALTHGMWKRCFTSGFFHDNLKAIVIDEAHCITEW